MKLLLFVLVLLCAGDFVIPSLVDTGFNSFCDRDLQTLRQLIVITRPGYQTPDFTFPSDIYQEDAWPHGFGQPTKKGLRNMFELGTWTRRCYNTFLDRKYNQNRVYSRSVNRLGALRGAQAYLAGSYPSYANYRQSKKGEMIGCLPHPFYVDSMLTFDDDLLLGHENCPRYNELVCKFEKTPKASYIVEKHLDFFDKLSRKSQLTNATCGYWSALEIIGNALFAELDDAKMPVKWLANPDVIEQIELYRNIAAGLLIQNTELLNIVIGALGQDIIAKLEARADFASDLEHVVYITESIPLETLLGALGEWDEFNFEKPPNGAAILIELHKVEDFDFVLVYYRHSDLSDPILLKVATIKGNNQAQTCYYTLDEFNALLSKKICNTDCMLAATVQYGEFQNEKHLRRVYRQHICQAKSKKRCLTRPLIAVKKCKTRQNGEDVLGFPAAIFQDSGRKRHGKVIKREETEPTPQQNYFPDNVIEKRQPKKCKKHLLVDLLKLKTEKSEKMKRNKRESRSKPNYGSGGSIEVNVEIEKKEDEDENNREIPKKAKRSQKENHWLNRKPDDLVDVSVKIEKRNVNKKQQAESFSNENRRPSYYGNAFNRMKRSKPESQQHEKAGSSVKSVEVHVEIEKRNDQRRDHGSGKKRKAKTSRRRESGHESDGVGVRIVEKHKASCKTNKCGNNNSLKSVEKHQNSPGPRRKAYKIKKCWWQCDESIYYEPPKMSREKPKKKDKQHAHRRSSESANRRTSGEKTNRKNQKESDDEQDNDRFDVIDQQQPQFQLSDSRKTALINRKAFTKQLKEMKTSRTDAGDNNNMDSWRVKLWNNWLRSVPSSSWLARRENEKTKAEQMDGNENSSNEDEKQNSKVDGE